MIRSKTWIRNEWKAFFDLYKDVNLVLRQKLEDLIIEEAMEDWPEGEGFGSSDRWCVIFNKFEGPEYDEETEEYYLPETTEEVEERVKRVIRDHCVNIKGDSETIVDCFLDNPDAFAKLFAPA